MHYIILVHLWWKFQIFWVYSTFDVSFLQFFLKKFTIIANNLKVEFQTSFGHSKITFFKNFELKKVVIWSQLSSSKIHLIFDPQSKAMDKFKRTCLKLSKKMSLPTPLWNLSITFSWSLKTLNGFLEIRLSLIPQLFLVQIFLKRYSTLIKWSLKLYFEHNSYVLTMSGQALIFNCPIPFEDSWWTIDFIIKSGSHT